MLSDVKNEKNLTKSEKQLKHKKHFFERESRKNATFNTCFKFDKYFLRHFHLRQNPKTL